MFQYQEESDSKASIVEESKKKGTKESLTRSGQRFNVRLKKHLLKGSKEIPLRKEPKVKSKCSKSVKIPSAFLADRRKHKSPTKPTTRISKYQLEKQKRIPVRNAKVDRKDRLASRRIDRFNEEVSINHVLLTVDSKSTNTSSKRGRSSITTTCNLIEGKSTQGTATNDGSNGINNTRSKRRMGKEIYEQDSIIEAPKKKIKSLKKQLQKKNGKDSVIEALKKENKRLKERLAKNDEKDSVIEALKKEIKEQLAQLNERETATEARNTEIKRLKEQLAKNNSVIEFLNLANSGKDTVIFSQMEEIERLKQKLSKKNEKNLVIDELIERLKQQLSNKTERKSVIVALIERLQKQLPEKKNEKDSPIEALNKKIDVRNMQIERLKLQLEKKKVAMKRMEVEMQIDAAKRAKVDVEVDPHSNFPLGSKTILDGKCYCCDVCKEAYFYSYDEACYHESLCQLYRNRIAAKAALEKVNKAFVEKMKSIKTKKSSGNSSAAEMNAPGGLKTSPVKEKNREESISKQVQEMQQALSKDLQRDLQCPICFNPMKDPCIVPECCHRFCYTCIEDAIAKCGKECPVCRARITSKRSLRRDELFGKIAEIVCYQDVEEYN
ncbi:hypothetical protein CTEN210_12058 [Chaetoceros tenuissimus]|uniref:RING-type E3 ubiquitin transferase n=1 Tax=Chaetoceros tenuissimus TaxID=426638 RepID=A0AAD3D0X4_9STRA|nr:hypothetical protein CTEN210_12058 [Chaetoceros tenuissimus]